MAHPSSSYGDPNVEMHSAGVSSTPAVNFTNVPAGPVRGPERNPDQDPPGPGTDMHSAAASSTQPRGSQEHSGSKLDPSPETGYPERARLDSRQIHEQVREPSRSPVQLRLVNRTPLSPFAPDPLIGQSRTGQVLLTDDSTIHKYMMQEDGSYSKVWSKPLPRGFTKKCFKRICDSGEILMQAETDSTTYMYNADFEPVTQWDHMGQLIGYLPPGRPVYKAKQQTRGRRDVFIVDREDLNSISEKKLTPDEVHRHYKWRGHVSVCESQAQGRIAVLASHNTTLDIFSIEGLFKKRVCLHYEGVCHNAMCCDDQYIYILGEHLTVIYIYDWSGKVLGCQPLSVLGIQPSDRLHAIQYLPAGPLLQLAYGSYEVVKSLNTYEICYGQAEGMDIEGMDDDGDDQGPPRKEDKKPAEGGLGAAERGDQDAAETRDRRNQEQMAGLHRIEEMRMQDSSSGEQASSGEPAMDTSMYAESMSFQ